MNTPAPFLLPFLRQTQHLHFLRRECFLHILLNFKVPNRASRVLKKSELSATFHCLSYSYPPSKCKCNERVLHLSDVAMHVDTCLPQPFLHCPLPIATFAEMNSILLCFMWDCLPKPPLPPRSSSLSSLIHFCCQSIYLYLTYAAVLQYNPGDSHQLIMQDFCSCDTGTSEDVFLF